MKKEQETKHKIEIMCEYEQIIHRMAEKVDSESEIEAIDLQHQRRFQDHIIRSENMESWNKENKKNSGKILKAITSEKSIDKENEMMRTSEAVNP